MPANVPADAVDSPPRTQPNVLTELIRKMVHAQARRPFTGRELHVANLHVDVLMGYCRPGGGYDLPLLTASRV